MEIVIITTIALLTGLAGFALGRLSTAYLVVGDLRWAAKCRHLMRLIDERDAHIARLRTSLSQEDEDFLISLTKSNGEGALFGPGGQLFGYYPHFYRLARFLSDRRSALAAARPTSAE